MPANAGTPLHERADHLEEEGLKKKTGIFLENPYVEVAICLLIILDVILVTIELMIDHNYACISGTVVSATPETVVAEHPVKEHHLLFLQAVAAGAWGRGFHSLKGALAVAPPAPVAPNLPVDAGFAGAEPRMHTKDTLNANVPAEAGDESIQLQEPEPKEIQEHEHAEGEHKGHEHKGHEHKGHKHEGGHAEGHGEGAHGHGHGHGHAHGPEALVCESKHGHNAHHIMHTCHTLSIAILCIFLVELLLKMWIAPKEFWADWLHILDLFVVVTSLIIDIYVSYLIEARRSAEIEAATIATLLVILRLWRVVRIAHGFNEIRNMELERRHKEMEELEEKKEAEKKKLEEVIKKHGLEAEVEAA
jgi:hypothetical protein